MNLCIRVKIQFHVFPIIEPEIVNNNFCAMLPYVIKLLTELIWHKSWKGV